ncbi:putative asparagine synthase, partial [Teladorsagia circumcincta]
MGLCSVERVLYQKRFGFRELKSATVLVQRIEPPLLWAPFRPLFGHVKVETDLTDTVIVRSEHMTIPSEAGFAHLVNKRSHTESLSDEIAPNVVQSCHSGCPTQHLCLHHTETTVQYDPGDVPSEQPIVGEGLSVVCNGEIYNHKDIKAESNAQLTNDGSDCAAIIHAFINSGYNLREACANLDGVFAFVMADKNNIYIGRDPLGVRPLFYGFSGSGALIIGSEVKCTEQLCDRLDFFPPGCCAVVPIHGRTRSIAVQHYYSIPCIADRFLSIPNAQTLIKDILIKSVEKRLMGNRQFGFMLSGGLDSSLIASIATKFLSKKPIAFSVGFEDSPDLESARTVAEYLNIPHDVLVITPEECLKVVPEVIYALETFDPLIIRCGIAHYLLCKHIAKTSDVKVLLSGEGADELFGSYAYMQRAPNAFHLHKEILRRLTHLHQYDVLRFIDLVARLPPAYKLIPMKLEKFILRSAFDGWLPDEVLWRSKEGFAEALGKTDLGDIVHQHASTLISEKLFSERADRFPDRTPETPEEYWYRQIFEDTFHYGKVGPLVHTKVY